MVENREQKKSFLKQRRWQISFMIIILFLAYTVSGFYLLPWILQTQAEKRLPGILLRQATINRVQFNPFTLRLQVDGFALMGLDGKKTFLKIDSLNADIAGLLSLSNRALVLEQIDIRGPYFDVVRNRDSNYNFSDILKSLTAPAADAKEEEPDADNSGFRFSLNHITLAGGVLEFNDNPANTEHKITDITISLPWISNFPQLIENDVEPSFSAVVNGTPIFVKGTSKPFNQTLETHFAINFDKLDLPYYLSYLPGERNFNLTSGLLTTRLDLIYVQEKDGRQKLTLDGGTVTVNDLLINGKDKEKDYRFLSFPELVITLGSGNLLAGEIFLDEIVCRKPELDFLHRPDGVYYLPQLIAAASSEGQSPPAAAAGKNVAQPDNRPDNDLVFKLRKMRLEEGIIRVYDKRVTPAFSTRFAPVDFILENLSTITGDEAQYQLLLKSDLGETLSLSGDLALSPLKVTTHFELHDLPLSDYVPYYKDYFAGRFSGGRLGLQGDVAVVKTAAGEIRMNLHEFACELDECRLSTPDGKLVLDLPRLAMAQGEIDFDEHECVIGSVSGERGRVTLIRQKNGALNLVDLVPAEVDPKLEPEKNSSAKELDSNSASVAPATQVNNKPWHLLLAKGALQDFSVDFMDQVPAAVTLIKTDKINLLLEHVGTGKGEAGKLKLSLRLARKGSLAVDGAVGLDPVKAEFNINLKKLPLPIFQNYLDDYLDLALLSGDFSTKGHLLFQEASTSGNRLKFSGNLLLDNLKTANFDRSEELLDWHRLELEKVVYDSQPPVLSINRVLSERLKVNLVKDSGGRTNFEKVVRQRTVPEKTASTGEVPQTATAAGRKPAAPEKTQALAVNIKKLELADSTFIFLDHSLSPSVEILLDEFTGSIAGISSSGEKPATVDLSGKLNNQAAISVSGVINPFPEELFVDLQIKGDGVGLTSVSSYSGKYVGYAVSKGKVSFDLSYQIKDYKLVAKNKIFIDQFDFGSTVESPDAMHLPIKMAVALLRNRQGEIDLNLPVSGDLNDPEFSLGGVIVKVFFNLITKAVTSPFALIGSIAGGGTDLNLITFAPGQAELDAATQQQLQKLAKVLYDRPGLKVEIVGHALSPGDREALQNAHFTRLLQQQKLQDRSGKKSVLDVAAVVIEKAEFEKYLWLAYKAAPMDKEKVLLGLVKKIESVEQERLLRAFVKVSDDELSALASQRARSVMNFLLEKGPIEAKRLFLVAPQIIASGSGSSDAEKGTQVEIKIK